MQRSEVKYPNRFPHYRRRRPLQPNYNYHRNVLLICPSNGADRQQPAKAPATPPRLTLSPPPNPAYPKLSREVLKLFPGRRQRQRQCNESSITFSSATVSSAHFSDVFCQSVRKRNKLCQTSGFDLICMPHRQSKELFEIYDELRKFLFQHGVDVIKNAQPHIQFYKFFKVTFVYPRLYPRHSLYYR